MSTARQWWDVVADAFDPVLRLRDDDPTPGHLAQRLDPMTVQTPALEIIDAHLVQVRDAIGVMYERRHRFAELVRRGVDEEKAIEQSGRHLRLGRSGSRSGGGVTRFPSGHSAPTAPSASRATRSLSPGTAPSETPSRATTWSARCGPNAVRTATSSTRSTAD
jgi:hypothetical protein